MSMAAKSAIVPVEVECLKRPVFFEVLQSNHSEAKNLRELKSSLYAEAMRSKNKNDRQLLRYHAAIQAENAKCIEDEVSAGIELIITANTLFNKLSASKRASLPLEGDIFRLSPRDLAKQYRTALDELPKERFAPRSRRRSPPDKPLTSQQALAVQTVAECEGNLAKAAKRMRLNRKTVQQHYEAGMKKTGARAVNAATKRLQKDKRGQEEVLRTDRRLNGKGYSAG